MEALEEWLHNHLEVQAEHLTFHDFTIMYDVWLAKADQIKPNYNAL